MRIAMLATSRFWCTATIGSRAALLVGVLAFMGCGGGPKTVPVSGVITLDNEPLANVVVTFSPITRDLEGVISSTGTTDASGKYSLSLIHTEGDGAVLGKHEVTIARNLQIDEAAKDADVAATKPAQKLPKHEFTYEVKEATDQANFNLQKKK